MVSGEPGAGRPLLFGVDWGTTHLRAMLLGDGGTVLARRASALGVASVRDGAFADALAGLLEGWRRQGAPPLPILMCGMVGSRSGWREVPYAACPADAAAIAANLAEVASASGPAWIVGGLCLRGAGNAAHRDVMRGEETQLLGLPPATGPCTVVLPGTHCKWVKLDGGAIRRFRTYMTGELYALLCRHSTIGWAIGEAAEPADDAEGFALGVTMARHDADLARQLFAVRARGILDGLGGPALAACLSGLLIGSEILSARREFEATTLRLVASPGLAARYQSALAQLGIGGVEACDGEQAVARGLWNIWAASGKESS